MNAALEKIPDQEVNTLPGLSDLEGVVRASEPKSILMLEADYVLRMLEYNGPVDGLLPLIQVEFPRVQEIARQSGFGEVGPNG